MITKASYSLKKGLTLKTNLKQRKLWMAAIKPPMYSVAVMPIYLGTAISIAETGKFNGQIFLVFFVSAILILAWENFSNDVFDADTGIDRNKTHSLVNLTGQKSLIFAISNFCLLTGILGVVSIAWLQQDATVLGLILMCCGLGYLYQGPPFRLGYKGLGEFLCFFSFGPLAVSAAYYSQSFSWSISSLIASLFLGISTSLILFCSHFHQVEDDLLAGKYSPVVRLGTWQAAMLLPWICGSLFGLTILGVLTQLFPIWTLLVFLCLPSAQQLCCHVSANHDQPDRVSNCKFIAVKLHFWSGLLLGAGFLLQLL